MFLLTQLVVNSCEILWEGYGPVNGTTNLIGGLWAGPTNGSYRPTKRPHWSCMQCAQNILCIALIGSEHVAKTSQFTFLCSTVLVLTLSLSLSLPPPPPPLSPSFPLPTQQAHVDLKIHKEHHRFVIGKEGQKLKNIELSTATKISIPRHDDSSDVIKIVGTKEGIDKARHQIQIISDEQVCVCVLCW